MKEAINLLRQTRSSFNPDRNKWGEGDKELFESLNKAIEKLESLEAFPLDDMFAVLVERDTYDPMRSSGSILMETMMGKSTMIDAVSNATKMGNRYGQAWVCKVTPIGTAEECEKIIDTPI